MYILHDGMRSRFGHLAYQFANLFRIYVLTNKLIWNICIDLQTYLEYMY